MTDIWLLRARESGAQDIQTPEQIQILIRRYITFLMALPRLLRRQQLTWHCPTFAKRLVINDAEGKNKEGPKVGRKFTSHSRVNKTKEFVFFLGPWFSSWSLCHHFITLQKVFHPLSTFSFRFFFLIICLPGAPWNLSTIWPNETCDSFYLSYGQPRPTKWHLLVIKIVARLRTGSRRYKFSLTNESHSQQMFDDDSAAAPNGEMAMA